MQSESSRRRCARRAAFSSSFRRNRRIGQFESLEERRVLDGSSPNMEFILEQSFNAMSFGFSTSEGFANFPATFSLASSEQQVAVDWYLYADDNLDQDINVAGLSTDIGDILETQLGLLQTDSLTNLDALVEIDDAPFVLDLYSAYVMHPDALSAASGTDLRFHLVARYMDGDGEFAWYGFSFGITDDGVNSGNTPPTITPVSGPVQGVPGQALTYVTTVVDTETPAANLTISWKVNGEEILVGSSQSFTYVPSAPGNYAVTATVIDGEHVITPNAVPLVVSSTILDGGTAYVGAASGGSTISISGTSVTVDGVTTTIPGATSFVVYGQAGNDVVLVSGATPVMVFAGAGNDIIRGGSGSDVLDGGAGTDIILGGAGRDVLVGGDGSDILLGNDHDDILIAGYTVDVDYAAVLAIWTGTGTAPTRIAAITAAGLLLAADTDDHDANVFDDDDIDILAGNAGYDWIFANLNTDGDGILTRDVVIGAAEQLAELVDEE